jgi:hypothetical protein
MISIGIAAQGSPNWWPKGAVMAMDFATSRYMRLGTAVQLGAVLSLTRSGTKLARNRQGSLVSFSSDAPAITDRGLSVEASATNSALYSGQIDNAWWSRENVSVVANAATAPTGAMEADKLIATDAGSINHGIYKTGLSTFSTQRVFAKAAELQWLCVRQGGVDCWFNLGNGTLGTVGAGRTASIEAHADGWYLCNVINTVSPNGGYTYRLGTGDNVSAFVADGSSGLYLWGSEARTGAHLITSSPVVTEASAVTRAEDQADLLLPSGEYTLHITFDDGSTQTLEDAARSYRLPTNLSRPVIRSIAVLP